MRVRYSFSSRRTGRLDNIKKQKKKFPDILQEIVRTSDIILEVLDARFLEETRNKKVEEEIKKQGKKLIYVFNKSDLVDIKDKKIESNELGLQPYVFVSCKMRRGGSRLRDKIKMEASKIELPHEKMSRVQVGIIGYPNTGKSSLINLLTGKTAARVGNTAGFTKGMQKVKLTSNILILDTPGVIPASEYSDHQPLALARHAKVNARDYSKVKNPEIAVMDLLREYPKELEAFYKKDFDEAVDVFIENIGKKRNFLRQKGAIDEDRAARSVLKDWQEGKIKF